MYDDVLVPTDGSETVAETLDHAIPIAVDNDATVHALYVIDRRITTAADDDSYEELTTSLRAEGEAAVAEVADRASDHGLDAVTEVREGIPDKEIRTYTEAAGIDLIVVGTTGKTPREKVSTLGSVSERVVDDAEVPVLVVRDAGDEASEGPAED